MGSLQVLRSTFGGRHTQWKLDDNRKTAARTFSSDSTTSAQNSSPVLSFPTGVYHLTQKQSTIQTHHQISMSLPERGSLSRHNSLNYSTESPGLNSSEVQAWDSNVQARPVASSSQTQSQTRLGCYTTQIPSRIPTPAKSPAGDLYPHVVYRKESKRSALSSLANQCVDMKRHAGTVNKENIKNREEQGIVHYENAQNFRSLKSLSDSNAAAKSRLQSRGYYQRIIDSNLMQRATATRLPSKRHHSSMPLEKSTPISYVAVNRPESTYSSLVSPEARSRPSVRLFNPVSALISRFETGTPRAESVKSTCSSASGIIHGHGKVLTLGKERIEHLVPKGKLSVRHQSIGYYQPKISRATNVTRKESGQMEYIPKGLRWTTGFENLKLEGRAKSGAFLLPNRARAPSQSATRLSPLSDAGSARLRDQTGRMVLLRSHSVGIRSRLKKPGLTILAGCVSQVSESQPQQYWLGRFVTLVNAFHYEDSFNEPDIATGFGMLSSYSRPLGHTDSNEAGYRIKRAFMVLENVCINDEASASLLKFRNEYIDKFGDRWMI
ncbi:hypothetical protein BDV23DRAFT_195674 [Aspergillus alliaceus]|uniref:Uncharacterized protein n=1 Tax=Petromyces alliaceus TaxID=209559 RepID=A0A5N7C1L7_PETAA|nr:hypothetical protein BDV23DRAFT_195674 [Aspergillus alliaceus]